MGGMADLVITPANVILGGRAKKRTGVAGAAISAGDLLYEDTEDGKKLKPVLADGTAVQAEVKGIAAHGAEIGQPVVYAYEDDDMTIGAAVAVGDVLIASENAGGIAPVADLAAGWRCTVVGVAKSTSKVNFKPVAAGAPKAA